jgi:hypothetical protein
MKNNFKSSVSGSVAFSSWLVIIAEPASSTLIAETLTRDGGSFLARVSASVGFEAKKGKQ